MDRLWTPWRLAYVTGNAPELTRPDSAASSATAAAAWTTPASGLTRRGSHRRDGRTCYVILNLYPYNNGHLMVVPKRHVAIAGRGRRGDELTELMQLTRFAEIALTEAYQPQGINVGINLGRAAGAGVVDHVHIHLRAALERRHQLHVRRSATPACCPKIWRKRRSGCGRSSNGC